jgi:hypothetical protein
MGCFRMLVALALLLLAAGFGLCGLILAGAGTGSDVPIGLTMILVALVTFLGIVLLLARPGRKPLPPREPTHRE